MINLKTVRNIILYSGVVDLRKGMGGLSSLVGDVSEGDLYLFSNRQRSLLKGLYRDAYGVRLSCCRLEHGTYSWPESAGGVRELSVEELEYLLQGQDLKLLIKRATLFDQN